MEHKNLPVAVHVFFLKEKEIFLMKRKNTGFKDGYWSVPAGRLDDNETIKQAAIREAEEEVGVKINLNDLSVPLVMHHIDDRGQRLYFFFICNSWTGKLRNLEADKCSAVKWVNINKLPKDIIDHVELAFHGLMNKEYFLEYGFSL